ncbi:hypothetical protein FN846DRAFT_966224 [Sphaerosporella brunnea]|uniref:Extracellular membrane protein CFEM domain-containing protein n=1 Tax=Sphaerosporella brunnea TaxID=1250544 RepID=A0A5J5ELQ6_9PEZI|nr:hypothetical protein FN846DRAFT_966224 [Sphaerosporella brunnea]
MKFTTALVVFGLVAAAAAQSSGTASAAEPTVTLSPEQKCLQSCSAGDVSCQSNCMGNPNPDASMVNATTACAAKCDQGDGSKAATEKYAACQQDCIKKYFFSSGANGATATDAATGTTAAATATGTGTSKAATATGTGASGTHTAASGTHAGSSSASSASASSAPANDAGTLAVSGAAGILAMVAAAFAL